ncbi:MAG TPA: Gfo/Idh/MocA family oxidoreductase, partial [Candidatus Eisenbacteria bacterium]|nr:Gfo/Idh/MocA family oxidoreductase [Candidatus Eisenbacteria bacterium]
LAEENQCKIAIGHIYRYFPVIGLLVKELEKGRFGRPLYGNVQVRWGHDQAYYDQAAWRGSRELDGGSIMNQSIHAMDLMHWLLGEPELLRAKGAVTTQIHDIESEDLGFGIFEFSDDRWFVLEGTTNTDPARPEASFFLRCSKGEIRAGILNSKLQFSVRDDQAKEVKNRYIWQEIKERISKEGLSYLLEMGNPHTGIYIDLIESILADKEPLANGSSGLQALEMVLALYEDAGVAKDLFTSN